MLDGFDYIQIHFNYDTFVAFKFISKTVNSGIMLSDKVKALAVIVAVINKYNVKNYLNTLAVNLNIMQTTALKQITSLITYFAKQRNRIDVANAQLNELN